MWISRIRVNGGFLAGLDVELSEGLNVIVGSRGVGKTTLLELIRHALGVPHADRARAATHERAVRELLGTGEVILDLKTEFAGTRIVVDAQGTGRPTSSADVALMLGQNELEEIASTPASRLQLIDLRAGVETDVPRGDLVKTLTEKIFDTRIELRAISDRTDTQRSLLSDFSKLQAREAQILAEAAPNINAAREQLRDLESQLAQVAEQLHQVDEARSWIRNASGASEVFVMTLEEAQAPSPGTLVASILSGPRERLLGIAQEVAAEVDRLTQELERAGDGLEFRENELRLDAEPLRSWLEDTEAGLGQLTAEIRNMQTQIRDNVRLEQIQVRLTAQLTHLVSERDRALLQMESWQEAVFAARDGIAREVSQELGGRVVVTVDHLANSDRFEAALVRMLQGSNLQYRPLARTLATTVLPSQLLRYVETDNSDGLAQAAGIGADRATRLLSWLSTRESLSELVGVMLDDHVDFRLRDGGVDKSVSKMSTGQKCAVTLPIVLSENTRVLILDQPEDHLDNAYLVDNIIAGINRRSNNVCQTIVASHNANIPVIGSADQVIYLESDGTRGRVAHVGPFDNTDIVRVITRVMEGGRDAFKLRMAFYQRAGQLT